MEVFPKQGLFNRGGILGYRKVVHELSRIAGGLRPEALRRSNSTTTFVALVLTQSEKLAAVAPENSERPMAEVADTTASTGKRV